MDWADLIDWWGEARRIIEGEEMDDGSETDE